MKYAGPYVNYKYEYSLYSWYLRPLIGNKRPLFEKGMIFHSQSAEHYPISSSFIMNLSVLNIHMKEYSSLKYAQDIVDEYLIKDGFKILSDEKFKKIQSLI